MRKANGGEGALTAGEQLVGDGGRWNWRSGERAHRQIAGFSEALPRR
jgi:hypothetical protein